MVDQLVPFHVSASVTVDAPVVEWPTATQYVADTQSSACNSLEVAPAGATGDSDVQVPALHSWAYGVAVVPVVFLPTETQVLVVNGSQEMSYNALWSATAFGVDCNDHAPCDARGAAASMAHAIAAEAAARAIFMACPFVVSGALWSGAQPNTVGDALSVIDQQTVTINPCEASLSQRSPDRCFGASHPAMNGSWSRG
jgi:hypothetical protein